MTEENDDRLERYITSLMAQAVKLVEIPVEAILKPRFCYECQGALRFFEYWRTNQEHDLKNLIDIWVNESVEIYCCTCFDNARRKEKVQKAIEEIPNRICSTCGRFLPIESFFYKKTSYLLERLDLWLDVNSPLTCILCHQNQVIQRLNAMKVEFCENGLKLKELKKLDLRQRYSFFINGQPANSWNDKLNQGDRLEVLMPKKAASRELKRLFEPQSRYFNNNRINNYREPFRTFVTRGFD